MWKFVSVFAFLFLTVSSLPLATDTDATTTQKNEDLPTLATELLPPRRDAEVADFAVDLIEENSSPSKDLLPPVEGTWHKGAVFLINLYAVKNETGENANEIFTEDVIKNTPELGEPFATVLLVLEEDDEKKPVSLDDLAKDLEEEGFKVEKFFEDSDTKVIKVDFDESIKNSDVELIKGSKINVVRKKRSPHLLEKLRNKHRGGGCPGDCGGGYNGGCQGGGCGGGTIGVIPVIVVPVQIGQGQHNPPPQYHPQPQYHQQQQPQYYPQPQYNQPHYSHNYPSGGGQCNTCGGNHGSHSQSSAQASAQSSSNSW